MDDILSISIAISYTYAGAVGFFDAYKSALGLLYRLLYDRAARDLDRLNQTAPIAAGRWRRAANGAGSSRQID
jgi:hypothetical protein